MSFSISDYNTTKEIKKVKEIAKIYEEKDYSKFKRLDCNRNVLAKRRDKIMASISEKYILCPIIVNEKYEVIDGQGRFEACKCLGRPIHFFIVPGLTSKDCIRLNKYNESWKAKDFADSYAKGGKTAYKLLLDCCKKTKLTIQIVMRLSNHGKHTRGRDGEMSPFEKGELNFSEKDYLDVISINEKSNDIIEALQCSSRVSAAFRTSVKIMVETEGYEHDKMLRNCEKMRATYAQASGLEGQLKEFERIYNRGAKNKLYFSDYMRNKGRNVRDYENYAYFKKYGEEDASTL